MSVGMNPAEAHAGGDATLTAASRLRDLPDDWSDAVKSVSATMRKGPGVSRSDWSNFGTSQEEHMFDVQEQAEILGNNIQASATEGANTDSESSGGYRETSSAPILNRALNEQNF